MEDALLKIDMLLTNAGTNAVMVEATALSEQVIDALSGFDAFISGCTIVPECTITDTPGLTPSIQNFYSDFLNPWTSTRR